MSKETSEMNLVPLQSALLDLYSEIAQVCDANKISYYVGYGTVLGAVRHKGMIPWDDDLDVMIPREDYDRFVRLAKNKLPGHLKFINWKNTPEFDDYLFGKVQDTRKDYVEALFSRCGRTVGHGAFVDIYPIDGYPKSWIVQCLLKMRMRFLRLWVWAGVMRGEFPKHKNIYPNRNAIHRLLGRVVCLLLFPFFYSIKSDHALARYVDGLARKWKFEEHGLVASWWRVTSHAVGTVWPSEVFGTGKQVPFADGSVRVPSDPNRYLEIRYGDYMKLPPPEQRKPGHVGNEVCPWAFGPTTDELPY